MELGRLDSGATFNFERPMGGDWGIEIVGGPAPAIEQPKPVHIEVFHSESDVRRISAGYTALRTSRGGVDARAEVVDGEVRFRVLDRWTLRGSVVDLLRKVEVVGSAPGGFASAIVLNVAPAVQWSHVECFAPGALYGDPTYNGERSPGGTLNNEAHRFVMREDVLPAPLFALSFKAGGSIAILDPAPRGDSTVDETKLADPTMTDARFQFGSIGARQESGGPIQLGFWFPGTVTDYFGGPQARTERRYHPIAPGVEHSYQVSFRFGVAESFPNVIRNSWRWACSTLKPAVTPIHVEELRRVLIDHLAAQAATIDGRTAIPFVLSTVTDKLQWNWTMVAMGFVGKNLECADLLIREGDRDPSMRGRKMRETGLAVISSMIHALPTVPLQGTGYDLATGKPWDHIWVAPWLRNATEDMRVLMRTYRRERKLGRDHPEWFAWVKTYVDWLLQQQRADGSFPRRWKPGSAEVEEPSGTSSYCPVPLLALMSEETSDPKYQVAAIRAAEYVWVNFGSKGLFVGGASDNPNITDKEAGMLSMEAFLSLYEATKDAKWLERAKTAGDFAESWMWIWNLPMPVDADDAHLHYKKGVSTIGIQGITALHVGSADEYLDWAVPSYAKLYSYTEDRHYLDVARILLHGTKSMVAMPGRLYDMKGIGWQQEGWRMGPGPNGRGVGGHRFWLPWISANHLYGIVGLEEYSPVLYKKLSRPAP